VTRRAAPGISRRGAVWHLYGAMGWFGETRRYEHRYRAGIQPRTV